MVFRRLSARVRTVPGLDSAWHLGIELVVLTGHLTRRAGTAYERLYAATADPWEYAGPLGRARHAAALGLLDTAPVGAPFDRVLEVGCAEGVFTEQLAPRCRSLIAGDLSATALTRARNRCDQANNVTFTQFNLKRDPLPSGGAYDLVVLMDVLEDGFGPLAIHNARRRLVAALRPGGLLLLGNSRQSPVFETSWWGKALIRGGLNIDAFFAQHAALRRLREHVADRYVLSLYERVPA